MKNVTSLDAHRAHTQPEGDAYATCDCGDHRFVLVEKTGEDGWVALRADGSVMAYSGTPRCVGCGAKSREV